MKRLIVCSLFLLLGLTMLQAAPWGGDASINPAAPHTAVDDPLTILKKLTSGQPVKVYFTFDDTDDYETLGFEPPDESDHEHSKIEYTKMLQIVADYWFQTATEAIKQTKRSAQFPEVLKHLRHSAKMQIVSKEDEADLRVYVANTLETVREKCKNEDTFACVYQASFTGKSPELIVSYYADEDLYFIFSHEWGHVLGLGDQYEGQIMTHPQYRSTNINPSLMAKGTLSYDDVDGLINLIDIIYGTEPARTGGWRSFVSGTPRRDVYVNGRVKGAGKYSFDFFGEESVAHLYTYANGKIVKEQEFSVVAADPFARIPNQQVLEKDHLGRPVHTKGPAGEDIYYLYDYNISHRLIIKAGKVIRMESLEKKHNEDGKEEVWAIARRFLFANKHTALMLNITEGEGGVVAFGYVEENEAVLNQFFYEVDRQGCISTTSAQIGDLHLTPEQMEKIGVQLRAWGKEQLQKIGFVPKSQVTKPAVVRAAAKPKTAGKQAPKQSPKPKAGQQTAKPRVVQKDVQYVREQLTKQLRK